MAVSAEPSSELDAGRRAIEDLDSEVVSVGPWQPSLRPALGAWQLELVLRPKDLGYVVPIPPVTRWFVLANAEYPRGHIAILPAKDGGIEDTFPHQEVNSPGPDDVPWRTGMVCLVHALSGHELAAARYDPITPYERLVWHVWRALEWLRAASRGDLIKLGEPFELPVFGRRDTTGPIVAFRESADSFAAWAGVPARGGLAAIASVKDGGRPVVAIRAFRDPRGRPLIDVPWGRYIAEAQESLGVWLRFDAMPIERYWRAPATWAELNAAAHAEDFDAIDTVAEVADRLRDGRNHLVLVGFPIPAVMGGPNCQYAWEAFDLPALHRKGGSRTAYPGFRPDKALIVADRLIGALSPRTELAWVRTENWHPDQLAARGSFAPELRDRRVLLLGAGALGSVIGDILVRGGVTDVVIVDAGTLEAGNLVRHTLSVASVGTSKALALAARLNAVSPNASVVGIPESFPNLGGVRERVEAADLVIDTTGSDAVLAGLGDTAWTPETTIASVSLSFGAEKLYAFAARGPVFPVGDFRQAIQPWSEAAAVPPDEFPWEGIGCWSSVFPARDDHVVQLAATAVSWLEGQLRTPTDDPRLVVWQRATDGTVARAATPVRP